jgi:hypothetical protein
MTPKFIRIHHKTISLPLGDRKYAKPGGGQNPSEAHYEAAARASLPLSDYEPTFPYMYVDTGK